MSRGDFGYGSLGEYRDDPYSNGPRNSRSPGGQAQGSSTYNELVDKISTKLFTISTDSSSLERSYKQLGTKKDTAQLRDKIHEIEQRTNKVINDTADLLRRLHSACGTSQRHQRLQYDRLMNEFKEVAERYSKLQRNVADKVRMNPATTVPQSGNLVDLGEDDQFLGDQHRTQLLAEVSQSEVEVDLMREREQNIMQLERDVLDINQIFRELGTLVHEQGEVIDTIESNVEAAASNVEAGTDQVAQAAKYQRKARKKKCILLIILLVVIAIITLIIVLSVKH